MNLMIMFINVPVFRKKINKIVIFDCNIFVIFFNIEILFIDVR